MSDIRSFPCVNCGAELRFAPGSGALKCPYCGTENEIASEQRQVEELDFRSHLKQIEAGEQTEERLTVRCDSCGAEVSMAEDVTAGACPFCGSNIVAQSRSTKLVKPRWLLPFKITREQAAQHFRLWIRKRWFAPNKVKQFARLDGLHGIYSPYWTYDCRTSTRYTGKRGEYYYTTETYTATENGKSVTRTRQVRHTRWYPAGGTVRNVFDDILVLGSKALPHKQAERLEPWDLENLVGYKAEYLSGFQVESYGVDLAAGFEEAQVKMEPVIRQTIRRDIGGDTQVIDTMNVSFADITFKHILLPVWISAYRFKEKVYRFLVNARTGEVQGERPWSWIKITLAALSAAVVVAAAVILISMYR